MEEYYVIKELLKYIPIDIIGIVYEYVQIYILDCSAKYDNMISQIRYKFTYENKHIDSFYSEYNPLYFNFEYLIFCLHNNNYNIKLLIIF